MNKVLKQIYIESRNEIDKLYRYMNNCARLVYQLNVYLNELKGAFIQYEKDKKDVEKYEGCISSLYEESIFRPSSPRVRNLERELKKMEYISKTATREESSAYSAGPFNVGFHHYDVPDEEERMRARKRANEIKDELESYGVSRKSILRRDMLLDIYQWKAESEKAVKQFEASKKQRIEKLTRFIKEARVAIKLAEKLEEKAGDTYKKIECLENAYKNIKKINLPTVNFGINEELLEEVLKKYQTSLNQENNWFDEVKEMEAVLENKGLAKFVFPQFKYGIKGYPGLFWDDYHENAKVELLNGKSSEIKSDYLYHLGSGKRTVKIVKNFEGDGYAILKVAVDDDNFELDEETDKRWKYMIVDVFGEIQEYKELPSNYDPSHKVKAVVGAILLDVPIKDLNPVLFEDKKFVQVLTSSMKLKHIYNNNLMGLSKGNFSKETKSQLSPMEREVD